MSEPLDATADGRTGLVTMSTEECWSLLEANGVGRIAVNVGSTLDIFPVNYFVRGGEIVIHTEAGTKLAAATMMSATAFEIDEIHMDTRKGWSVVVKGHGREATQLEEILEFEDLAVQPWVEAAKTRWLVITPYEVTGRRVP